jgi:putative oxidoreductase
MHPDGTVAQKAAKIRWVADIVGFIARVSRLAERGVAPVVDLIIRLWLAQIFFVSAIIKLANWDNALNLARYEYPVRWMEPVTAAYLGVSIELIGAILLAAGLATRLAALSMLVLSLVIQLNYRALDTHLFWAVLFGWYVVRGAGPLSIDRLLARGLAESALPLAASVTRLLGNTSRYAGPVYQLLMRAWLLLTLWASWSGASNVFLAPNSASYFLTRSGSIGFALVALGLGTRIASAIFVLLLLATQMTDMRAGLDIYWISIFALFALHGAGKYSADHVVDRALRGAFPQLDGKPAFSLEGLPRVVIVGAGFGGLTCATKLARTPVQITLIDRHNYHLFQPLLYQVATTALSPGDIATPVRGLFRDQFNIRVLLGNVSAVDRERQFVSIGGQSIPYDYLVLATGAAHSYFGKDEWAAFAPGLKRIEDATEIRRRILTAFERAEVTEDSAERESLLTFLVVGGGPTGVELAGAIAELAKFGMEKEFRSFDPASARVLVVQAGDRILPTFPGKLSAKTQRSLEKLGVEVLTNSRVEHIDDFGVQVNGKRIPSRTVLWAAGVVASPAAKWLDVKADKAGRVIVDPDLSVPGIGNVFALGDTALSNAWNGQSVPGLAPAAKQGGAYVAHAIRARILGKPAPQAFRYTHLGSLATIGRKAAVADFGFARISGTAAWWLWGFIHIGFLVGVRNRISVVLDWFWAYLTFRSGTRLITGRADPAPPPNLVATPTLPDKVLVQ